MAKGRFDRETYIKEGGTKCPWTDCNSEDIEGESDISVCEMSEQEIHCNTCQRRWTDVYELIGVEELA